jgi:hypothetical protein
MSSGKGIAINKRFSDTAQHTDDRLFTGYTPLWLENGNRKHQ